MEVWYGSREGNKTIWKYGMVLAKETRQDGSMVWF